MPLIVSGGTPPPSIGGGGGGASARVVAVVSWFGPDGTEFKFDQRSLILNPGATGLGAAPREVARQAIPTGGGFARWSYAAERLISLPVTMIQDEGPDELRENWRRFVQSFAATTPPAGRPRPGRLRYTYGDGSWREIGAYYLEGLEGDDADAQGIFHRHAVISLVAPDPWFYSEGVRAAKWEYREGTSYLNPYETVSPGLQLGVSTLTVAGDVDALPTWTITGPATSVTAMREDGALWTYAEQLDSGEKVVVDVITSQVTDEDGKSVIGNLVFPESKLWTLPAGTQSVNMTIEDAGPGSAVELTYRPRFETS